MNDSLLEVDNLSVSFQLYSTGTQQEQLEVISDLSLTLRKGEILAVAGSSGSGKSLLAHAILGLLPKNAKIGGGISYKGTVLTDQNIGALRGTEIALIPQSLGYFDPLMKMGKQVVGSRKNEATIQKQKNAFLRLGLDSSVETMYPFQLSGGMARRSLFSTAVISEASLIVADEPTPGMDTAQAIEALSILKELARSGKSVLLITHDIDLAFLFADRVAVFYGGTTLEETPVKDFTYEHLRHPYSKALWQALPQNGFSPIPGVQPYAKNLPKGCLFAPQCTHKTALCEESRPPSRTLRGGIVRCFHAS